MFVATLAATIALGSIQAKDDKIQSDPLEFLYVPISMSAVSAESWKRFMNEYAGDDAATLKSLLVDSTIGLVSEERSRRLARPRTPQSANPGAPATDSNAPLDIFFPAQRRIETLLTLPNESSSLDLFKLDQKASLGILGLGANASKDQVIYVAESLRYADVFMRKIIVRVGVGIRVIVKVDARGAGGKLSLGSLAASASSNRLEANMEAYLLGISGGLPAQLIDIPDQLNLSTLESLYRAIGRVKTAIWANPANETHESQIAITPQILAISVRKADLNHLMATLDLSSDGR